MTPLPGFESYMQEAAARGRLVVQPRMGFSTIAAMQSGLKSVKEAVDAAPCIGTVTIDAFTRRGRFDLAAEALAAGRDLNGFPIVSHGTSATQDMLQGIRDQSFPVQIRHGTPFPQQIFETAAAAGFDAIEGGPVSYNLPYAREPLADTVKAWKEALCFWAEHGERHSRAMHVETFGGCMLGQLAPPSLPVALSLLEGRFFVESGVRAVSFSLTQGVNDEQDIGALLALSRLAERYFPAVSWHVVFYTFMGRFPRTLDGARAIIEASARIAVRGGAHRLIVKTAAEAHGIPTVEQNVEALSWARQTADGTDRSIPIEALTWAEIVEAEAEALILATLDLAPDCGTSLTKAFANGILDVPFCIHPDNRNEARATLDPATNALVWAAVGRMPLRGSAAATRDLNSRQFHDILDLNRRRYENITQDNTCEAENA